MEVVVVVVLAGASPAWSSDWPWCAGPASIRPGPGSRRRTVAVEINRHPSRHAFIRRRTDPATATGLALTAAVALAAAV